MEINLQKLKNNLISLGFIGYNGDKGNDLPYGDKGITRLPFTKEYDKADNFVVNLMKKAGLEIKHDSIGNLFGTLSTNKDNDEHIIIGSHIDTVPQGGIFDGALGVLAAIESLKTLQENNYDNNYNLTVVAFIGEEGREELGGTFGSRCFTGDIELTNKEIEFLDNVGINPEDVKNAKTDGSKIKNYLEMHIEQGAVLENEEISIGIVQGIVGIARYKAIVNGEANHAGTTPMKLRNDALIKASKYITKINEIVKEIGGDLVGTVGEIEVEPGAVNVIPGKCEFSIELRDMEKKNMEGVITKLKEIAKNEDLIIEDLLYEGGVYFNKEVQKAIKNSAEKLSYSYKEMISGAGHDANPLSEITSTGMIFVPSHKGISHSPQEWTDWEDIKKGTEVMLETIKYLDQN
ncbi:MAG: M20 family metallo-hydrolase [Halanaerobiales bacterium]